MTKYCVLQKINFWNEDIFLDFADYDLCWRLNKNGLYSFITNNVTLEHCLGEGIVKTNCETVDLMVGDTNDEAGEQNG